MNAVKLFREIMKNLTDQEKEDLSHLRLNNINGALFDDREAAR